MAKDDENLPIQPIGRTAALTGPQGADALQGVEAVAGAESSPLDAVAAALAAGELDAASALDAIVATVVAEQLPPGASTAEAEALTAQVSELLRDDPTLGALLRS